ncbi:S-norcoclaurine synthase [Hordeum vulgare]|nr:S-norcoclaurine synthase [Hordeum vulgare]
MKGSLCHELKSSLSAAEVWEVYGGVLLGQLIPQLLPDVLSKVEVVVGDGGVGTVLRLTFPPGDADKTSTIRSTVEYEVHDEHTGNASFVTTSTFARIAEAITKYIKAQKGDEQTS